MNSNRRKWPTILDLYSGCGTVTAAFKKCHFRVVAAVDIDPVACSTYKRNHPSIYLIQDDIRNVDPRLIRKEALRDSLLDLLVVCAPCQPFSNQNQYKNDKDNRKELILESVRFAKVLQPRMIMFENVPGLAGKSFVGILEKLINSLSDIGYLCGPPTRINAADYGVPQRRNRCILLAALGQKPPKLPQAITPEGSRVTVARVLKGLTKLATGQYDKNDPLHFSRNHSSIALKRLAHIPKNGGSRASLPPNLVLNCHKDPKSYPDVYGRMSWNDIAPTLTTGCTDITRGRFAHPDEDRAITLREAARLQTFPDDYLFEGNASQIATQIGNAVPMKLVESLAPTLRKAIRLSPKY
jgi:DNA (cytosine-5)-methyltransferase 1